MDEAVAVAAERDALFNLLLYSSRNHDSPCRIRSDLYHQCGETLTNGDHPTHTFGIAKASCTPKAFVDSYRYVFWH